jgi:phosphopantetheinyl transferase
MSAQVTIVLDALDVAPATLARHWETLSLEERARAACFAREPDRARFVGAHGILREILGCELGHDPAALVFAVNAFGKPYLVENGARHGLRFSLSHTGAQMAVGFAWRREIGVDIESSAAADRRDVHAWVRAEARLKAQGCGFAAAPAGRYALCDFDPGAGLVGAVAAEGAGIDLRLVRRAPRNPSVNDFAARIA